MLQASIDVRNGAATTYNPPNINDHLFMGMVEIDGSTLIHTTTVSATLPLGTLIINTVTALSAPMGK